MLTVIVVTYNQPQTLERCLRSLHSYANFPERVIVANNHKDSAPFVDSVVSQYDYEAIHCDNEAGIYGAVRKVSEKVRSPLMAWIHDDVVFPPNSECFWQEMSKVAILDEVGFVGPSSNTGDGLQHMLRTDSPDVVKVHNIHTPCTMVRKSLYDELGKHDLSMVWSADYDLCIRAHLSGYQNVVCRRSYIHHDSATSMRKKFETENELKIWIRELMQITNNELIRKHGVRVFYEYLRRSYEWDSVQATCIGYDDIIRALSQKPEAFVSG